MPALPTPSASAAAPDAAHALAPRALYQEVAERLRQQIYARVLEPGSWIDETKLAKAFGISRTPLREALKVLAAEGLVELVPHRGCRVIELTDDDADDLFPVMAMLEELHLRLGAATAELSQRLGRAPTATELALELEMDRDEVVEGLVAGSSYNTLSIDSGGGGGESYGGSSSGGGSTGG